MIYFKMASSYCEDVETTFYPESLVYSIMGSTYYYAILMVVDDAYHRTTNVEGNPQTFVLQAMKVNDFLEDFVDDEAAQTSIPEKVDPNKLIQEDQTIKAGVENSINNLQVVLHVEDEKIVGVATKGDEKAIEENIQTKDVAKLANKDEIVDQGSEIDKETKKGVGTYTLVMDNLFDSGVTIYQKEVNLDDKKEENLEDKSDASDVYEKDAEESIIEID